MNKIEIEVNDCVVVYDDNIVWQSDIQWIDVKCGSGFMYWFCGVYCKGYFGRENVVYYCQYQFFFQIEFFGFNVYFVFF